MCTIVYSKPTHVRDNMDIYNTTMVPPCWYQPGSGYGIIVVKYSLMEQ